MSVILVDLGNEDRGVVINNRGWSHTVDVIKQFGIFEPARLDLLQEEWIGKTVDEEEARSIGNALLVGPLRDINWLSDVYPPAGYFAIHFKDPYGREVEYTRENYWPAWLRDFAAFCLVCKGFIAY